MAKSGESQLIEWLTGQSLPAGVASAVRLGVGDDMAILDVGGSEILVTSDMLLDGVHFETSRHDLPAVGRKALACGLSDCAAMAVRPLAATVSVALPDTWSAEQATKIYEGMRGLAEEFGCGIVGGDTTAWDQRFAIDVNVVGVPFPECGPVRRSGAKVGDALLVTGRLGGSLLGKHLTFTPRVREAHGIVEAWGCAVHAMMDISDGLGLDLHRLCKASKVGAVLERDLLERVISDDARRAAEVDDRTPLEHALSDGEDFELLLAVDSSVADGVIEGVTLLPIGRVVDDGVGLRGGDGVVAPIAPRGFEHLA